MISNFLAWLATNIARLMIQATINGLYRDRATITGQTPADYQHKRVIDQDITQLEGILQGLNSRTRCIPTYAVIKEKQ